MIFEKDTRVRIEANVLKLMNETQLMNENTADSPRAVGDAVQSFLEGSFSDCLPNGLVKDFNAAFARRAMADFAFTDINDLYYVVDNKTHNLNTQFNMPNLTSVERLARFYEDDNNYFTLLLLSYKVDGNRLIFHECHFVPIENLEWSCLTLGALGWGQVQIANSNSIKINIQKSRKTWMLELCDALGLFYPKEIEKITARIDHFRRIREYWQAHPDL